MQGKRVGGQARIHAGFYLQALHVVDVHKGVGIFAIRGFYAGISGVKNPRLHVAHFNVAVGECFHAVVFAAGGEYASRSGPGVVDEYVDNRSEPRCRVAMYAVINSPMATTRYLLREFIVKKLFRTWCILCTMSGILTNLIFLQVIEDVGGEPFNVFPIRVRAGVLAPFIGGEAFGHAAAV